MISLASPLDGTFAGYWIFLLTKKRFDVRTKTPGKGGAASPAQNSSRVKINFLLYPKSRKVENDFLWFGGSWLKWAKGV